jgi:hypothetical protein
VENESSWGMGWPAVVFDYDGTSTILNSILWDNIADGNQIFLFHDVDSSTPTTVTIGYSDIQGGQSSVSVGSGSTLNWGDGNIDVDPCFAEPGYWHPNDTPLDTNDDFLINGDYHLKSEAGRWEWSELIRLDSTGDGFIDFLDLSNFASYWKHTRNPVIVYDWWQKVYPYVPADLDASGIVDFADLGLLLDSYLSDYNIGQWVKDDVRSPCIDAGDPNSDWTEELWPNGHRINMGAYGGTRQASMSLSTLGNIADLNGDDVVNFRDYAWFAELWEVTGMLLAEDLDRNGAVNSIDAGVFVDNWLWEQ